MRNGSRSSKRLKARDRVVGLSPRQTDVLKCIKKSLRVHGMPPTVREIADEIGHKSVGSVTPMVKALIKKGFVKNLRKRMARGIVPTGMGFVESGRRKNAKDNSMIVDVSIVDIDGKTKHLQVACRSIVIRKYGPAEAARKR